MSYKKIILFLLENIVENLTILKKDNETYLEYINSQLNNKKQLKKLSKIETSKLTRYKEIFSETKFSLEKILLRIYDLYNAIQNSYSKKSSKMKQNCKLEVL